MRRSRVNKRASARNFRSKQRRTKRANVISPMRGGFRI